MSCYYPMTAYRSKNVNENGKRELVFNREDGYTDMPIQLPCGKCIGCKMQRSLEMAVRCNHEAKWYLDRGMESSFITLTYDRNHPINAHSLDRRDFDNFMKRLRKANNDIKIRYYACGEYGDQYERAHFHAILFGYQPDDLVEYTGKNGTIIYRSEKLSKLWHNGRKKGCVPFGDVTIGTVTFDSITYVTGHIIKILTNNAVTGERIADRHYKGRVPEFAMQSTKPGIGYNWYAENKDWLFKCDHLEIRNGIRVSIPRYYEKKHEEETHNLIPNFDKDGKIKFKMLDIQLERIKYVRKKSKPEINDEDRKRQEDFQIRKLFNSRLRRKLDVT